MKFTIYKLYRHIDYFFIIQKVPSYQLGTFSFKLFLYYFNLLFKFKLKDLPTNSSNNLKPYKFLFVTDNLYSITKYILLQGISLLFI